MKDTFPVFKIEIDDETFMFSKEAITPEKPVLIYFFANGSEHRYQIFLTQNNKLIMNKV